MSAAESREVLEAVIWRALTACHVRGTPVCGCKANVTAILGMVDTHATEVARQKTEQAIAALLADPEALAARQRLAVAAAETARRPA